jgi:hypothetical protein
MREMAWKGLYIISVLRNSLGIDSRGLVSNRKNFYTKKMGFKLG